MARPKTPARVQAAGALLALLLMVVAAPAAQQPEDGDPSAMLFAREAFAGWKLQGIPQAAADRARVVIGDDSRLRSFVSKLHGACATGVRDQVPCHAVQSLCGRSTPPMHAASCAMPAFGATNPTCTPHAAAHAAHRQASPHACVPHAPRGGARPSPARARRTHHTPFASRSRRAWRTPRHANSCNALFTPHPAHRVQASPRSGPWWAVASARRAGRPAPTAHGRPWRTRRARG
jgi:hypothetical protein